MNSRELFAFLGEAQKKKGYFFNRDEKHTLEILEGLLINKERYGYMACPCRLAAGEYENDRDIICPCEYRDADLVEFGSCYCNLYVTEAYNAGQIEKVKVPERRPPEKMEY
jgi:ferredoxin-thioredoxin reductase catalytic chain